MESGFLSDKWKARCQHCDGILKTAALLMGRITIFHMIIAHFLPHFCLF